MTPHEERDSQIAVLLRAKIAAIEEKLPRMQDMSTMYIIASSHIMGLRDALSLVDRREKNDLAP